MSAKPDMHLSEAQLAVMRVLWHAGRATTATVHERAGRPRGLAYTTVATMLTRLEKRGVLRSVKEGRERVFVPSISEDDVRRQMVSSLVSNLFRGDAGALVSHLVRDAEIDADDIDTVRRLLEENRNDR